MFDFTNRTEGSDTRVTLEQGDEAPTQTVPKRRTGMIVPPGQKIRRRSEYKSDAEYAAAVQAQDEAEALGEEESDIDSDDTTGQENEEAHGRSDPPINDEESKKALDFELGGETTSSTAADISGAKTATDDTSAAGGAPSFAAGSEATEANK